MSEAELFITGEISRGSNFPGYSMYCSYEIIVGNQWKAISGTTSGNTHVMEWGLDGTVSWSTPIDAHFAFQSVQGWPKISLRVWSLDYYDRKDLVGYGVGFIPMPTKQSDVTVTVETWKPTFYKDSAASRIYNQMRQFFMGGNPVLSDDSLIHNNDGRKMIYTTSGGTVDVTLSVMTRNAEAVGLRFE